RPGPVRADGGGRSLLTGGGADATAELHVSGPAIELKRVNVSTKLAPGARPEEGVRVEVVAGPTKVVEGTVRARDTGKPLAGVVLYGKHADFRTLNDDENGPRAVTDAPRRYRLPAPPTAH